MYGDVALVRRMHAVELIANSFDDDSVAPPN
jgi:hypothetical protein